MTQQADRNDRKVCIGAIAGPHGVNGLVRLKSFTADPEAVAAYGPVTDAAGLRQFRIVLTGAARDMLLARIDGVADRTAAEALRGVELYVERGRLPAPEADEFYHADLIGLPARATDGSEIGTVTALYELVPPEKLPPPDPADKPSFVKPVEPSQPSSDKSFIVRLRWKQPEGETAVERAYPVADDGRDYARASDDFKFASAVTSFALVLRNSKYKGSATLEAAQELAESSKGEDRSGYRAEYSRISRVTSSIPRPGTVPTSSPLTGPPSFSSRELSTTSYIAAWLATSTTGHLPTSSSASTRRPSWKRSWPEDRQGRFRGSRLGVSEDITSSGIAIRSCGARRRGKRRRHCR